MRLADLHADLLADGYRPGAPPPGPFGGQDIDAGVCAEAHCSACGRQGLDFHPYRRPAQEGQRASYRAVAACPACGEAEEF